jgi:TolA-binding protein
MSKLTMVYLTVLMCALVAAPAYSQRGGRSKPGNKDSSEKSPQEKRAEEDERIASQTEAELDGHHSRMASLARITALAKEAKNDKVAAEALACQESEVKRHKTAMQKIKKPSGKTKLPPLDVAKIKKNAAANAQQAITAENFEKSFEALRRVVERDQKD